MHFENIITLSNILLFVSYVVVIAVAWGGIRTKLQRIEKTYLTKSEIINLFDDEMSQKIKELNLATKGDIDILAIKFDTHFPYIRDEIRKLEQKIHDHEKGELMLVINELRKKQSV